MGRNILVMQRLITVYEAGRYVNFAKVAQHESIPLPNASLKILENKGKRI